MENTTLFIAPKASKATVQDAMNKSVGEIRWHASSDGSLDIMWINLLAARAQFVTKQLVKDNLTLEQLAALPSLDRRVQVAKMADAFTKDFFQYTRDKDKMQEAIGDKSDWLNIPGMGAWHVKAAIHSLKRKYHRSVRIVSYLVIVPILEF